MGKRLFVTFGVSGLAVVVVGGRRLRCSLRLT